MRSLLILVLSLVLLTDILAEDNPRLTSCLSEKELQSHMVKMPRRFRTAGRRSGRAAVEPSCSEFSRTHFSPELRNRSLSPWRLVSRTEPALIPSTYEEAVCLCSGCIINGQENTDYNSVPVNKSVMFLEKVPCDSEPQKYYLKIHHKEIPVACTCAVPRQ